ncbi:MAG: hypothetical protein HOP15_04265 [Planctomycetes bacterium]|nr:hypothetical protein [Planctomycetota bacterium]
MNPQGPYHSWNSDTHYENSDVHWANSDYHSVNSDFHAVNSDFHSANTDTHYHTTDIHLSNSDSHKVNSDSHQLPSNTHYESSDSHDSNSNNHSASSDDHAYSSATHASSSDAHDGYSTTHAMSSANSQEGASDPPEECGGTPAFFGTTTWFVDTNPTFCMNGAVDFGTRTGPFPGNSFNIASVRGSGIAFTGAPSIHCTNAEELTLLTGAIRLVVESGDPTIVSTKMWDDAVFGFVPYSLGATIPVSASHGYGCQAHAHYASLDTTAWNTIWPMWLATPLRPGTVTLRMECVPDGGIVRQESCARMTFTVPAYSAEPLPILAKMFIECAVVDSPPEPFTPHDFYQGDNRSFSFELGWNFDHPDHALGSRSAQRVVMHGDGSKHDEDKEFGVSFAFDDDNDAASGPAQPPLPYDPGHPRPDCTYYLVDPTIDAEGVQTVSPSTSKVTVTALAPEEPGDHAYRVTFFLAAKDPLLPDWAACAADAEVSVEVLWYAGHWFYRTSGRHDQYPSFELYLGGNSSQQGRYIYRYSHQGAPVVALCPWYGPQVVLPPEPAWLFYQ